MNDDDWRIRITHYDTNDTPLHVVPNREIDSATVSGQHVRPANEIPTFASIGLTRSGPRGSQVLEEIIRLLNALPEEHLDKSS